MNKKKYLVGALAALMMAGCSDDITEGSGIDDNPVLGEKAYIKLAINLPTTSGANTRANNDVFDDGLEDEYKVNDAYLLIFQGKNESTATLQSWYNISTAFELVGDDDDNVTSHSELSRAIASPSEGNKAYALVVLNNNSNLTFDSTTPAITGDTNSGTSVTINGTEVETLSSLQTALEATIDEYIGDNKKSFTMTNAPIAALSGAVDQSNQNVTTLVELDLFNTQEMADGDTDPDEIYVERVAAKVTVAKGSFEPDDEADSPLYGKYYMPIENEGTYEDDRAYLEGWYLNVTNKSTKFVRDVKDWSTWKTYKNNPESVTANRFFGTIESPYRVYWAIDGNYDSDDLTNAFNVYTDTDAPYVTIKDADSFDTPAYCLENTFDTDHMRQRETTGIVFKMTYMFDTAREPKTFYVIGEDKDNPVYAEGEGEGPGATQGLADKVNTLLAASSSTEFGVDLAENYDDLPGGYISTIDDIQKLFVKDETSVGSGESNTLSDNEAKQILDAVESISVYKNGTTYYYAARIKHFGDEYCKVNNGYVDDVTDYTNVHLGRYGVVRNNWYEIEVKSISGPGMPEEPDPTTPDPGDEPDPDDPKEMNYINCNINVLSWAKREQSVDL